MHLSLRLRVPWLNFLRGFNPDERAGLGSPKDLEEAEPEQETRTGH